MARDRATVSRARISYSGQHARYPAPLPDVDHDVRHPERGTSLVAGFEAGRLPGFQASQASRLPGFQASLASQASWFPWASPGFPGFPGLLQASLASQASRASQPIYTVPGLPGLPARLPAETPFGSPNG